MNDKQGDETSNSVKRPQSIDHHGKGKDAMFVDSFDLRCNHHVVQPDAGLVAGGRPRPDTVCNIPSGALHTALITQPLTTVPRL